MNRCKFLFFSLFAFTLVGCIQRSEDQVIVYCSVDREFAKPILDAYERTESATKVERQFDVESTKSVGLATRIIQERQTPRCDVFWNGEILQTLRLQKEGLLLKRQWKQPKDLRGNFPSNEGWSVCAARGRILLVNRDRIQDRSKWPTSVAELADSRWKEQCGLASPLFGSTSTHFAILSTQQENFLQWCDQVQTNAIVLSGNKQVAQAVAKGQLSWGLTDTDDALIEIENGSPVEIVFPDQAEDQKGFVLIPSTVAVLANSPHPVAAGLVADYLTSEATANRLTMASAAQFNLWPNQPFSNQFENADQLKIMQVDYNQLVDHWEKNNERLQSIFLKSNQASSEDRPNGLE